MTMSHPPYEIASEIASGVTASTLVEATSAETIVSVLTEASAENRTVVPFGGAHSVVTGHEVGPFDIGLDLRPLSGILSHEPADLVLSVRAGTTIGEIQSILGDGGQALPLDIPYLDTATIGGVVATGFAGPRRLRSGSLRDLLIGCEYARGDGLLARGGGMVVKNVSGFEIPRFLHGSWGALAVITSVNLKVFPQSRADGSLIAKMPDLPTALQRAQAIIANGSTPVDACTLTVSESDMELAVRVLGRQRAVAETLEACGQSLEEARTLQGGESSQFWQDQVERFAEEDEIVGVAFSTRPRLVAELAKALMAALAGCPGLKMLVSPGLGVIRLRWPTSRDSGEWLRNVVRSLDGIESSYVVECAPRELRSVVSPWGAVPAGIDTMRAIKREFDPAHILNRGRLFL